MPTIQRSHQLRVSLRSLAVLCVPLCALVMVTSSCKDEEPIPLFDEQGTWYLKLFDLAKVTGKRFGSGFRRLDHDRYESRHQCHEI